MVVSHALPEEQIVHGAPPLPQAPADVPTWHAPPRMQPVQQLPLAHLPPGQGAPVGLADSWHAPVEQSPLWQGLVELQGLQSVPPEPQKPRLIPPLHTVPCQQPVQHWPWLQVPPGHAVPLGLGAWEQAPALQLSVVQGRLSSQLAHGLPPAPQCWGVTPVWHAAPSQQPVQHDPERHSPPVHGVPSGRLPLVSQAPATQLPLPHSPTPCPQSWHADPAAPQAPVWVPGRHARALSQHPWQSLAGQLPPQPSAAPAHLPAQAGVQASGPSAAPASPPALSVAPSNGTRASTAPSPGAVGTLPLAQPPTPAASSASASHDRPRLPMFTL